MAVDYFLKIDGIQGDSQDAKHKAEIDIISFSWNVTRNEGRVRVTDFKIVKAVDRASPLLVQTALQCSSPGSAWFVARKAGGGGAGAEYLKITMKDVLVTSVSPNSGTDVPLETVTLGFKSAEMKVAALKADGSLDAYVTGVIDPSNGCGNSGER